MGFVFILTLLSVVGFSMQFNFFGLQHVVPTRVIEQDTEHVEFLLYPKKETPRYREELIVDDALAVNNSLYDSSKPLTLLIHGFVSGSKSKSGFVEIVKNAYLRSDIESNIVAVDWSHLSSPKTLVGEALYKLAALNVKPVGRKVADFILFMLKNEFVSGHDQIHIVGFSLGAHVAGKAGRYVFLDTGKRLNRITGLDPAGPDFAIKPSTAGKLDSEDAEFVDVVHTDQGQLGYFGPLGHIDFYANGGGPVQPNCSYLSLTTGGCSHSSSYRYFAKSIRDEHIVGCKCNRLFKSMSCMDPCDNPTTFGQYCPPTAHGIYYVPVTFDAEDA